MGHKIVQYGKDLIIMIVLVCLDQWTKYLAVAHLKQQPDIILIPKVLQLHYLENTGAAFSMLENKMLLFYISTPIIVALIFYVYIRISGIASARRLQILLVLIMAGAIGNFIDRILHQYVVDFIYFSLIDFPVFNVADIYVTCSVILLFLLILFGMSENDLAEMTDAIKWEKKA
jgi:signal peptidase II